MRVRTVREHGNELGSAFEKKVGDEYEVPEQLAQSLVANDYVELVSTASDDPAED